MSARDSLDAEQHDNLASRLWRKDASLWRASTDDSAEITAGLGWLNCIEWMQEHASDWCDWAERASREYERVVLLGMGGASLASAVMASLFKPVPGRPELQIVDTTNPEDIARAAEGDVHRRLFIVASKSGLTLETFNLYTFFHKQLATRITSKPPDPNFVIITDKGSPMQKVGELAGAAKIFRNPDGIGGRYSALSYFGMVPAALLGVDVAEVLARARDFCATTKSDSPAKNPALALGLLLGRAALSGRDKLVLRLPPELRTFGMWVEQLVAESSGKEGKGLLPVLAADDNECGGADRVVVRIDARAGANTPNADHALRFDQPLQIGAEFFRWEVAVAIAAACLRVNPFDQPDVARTKEKTLMYYWLGVGEARAAPPPFRGEAYDLYCPRELAEGDDARGIITDFFGGLAPPGYLALLAYLPEEAEIATRLESLRACAAAASGAAVTLGFGPRYLHSTGQYHKGGPRNGRFILFTSDAAVDVPAPGRKYTFGKLHHAQADGDFAALAAGGAPVLRVHLKADRLRALDAFASALTARPKTQ